MSENETRTIGRRARAQASVGRVGLTLVELIVVLFVLVALAGLLVPTLNNAGRDASETATRTTLATVAGAIVGPGGYVESMRFAQDLNDALNPFGDGSGLPWPGSAEIGAGRVDQPQLNYLFRVPLGLPLQPYDAISRIGWNGPWLDASAATVYDPVDLDASFTAAYGDPGDIAPIDGWGNPVVIQYPIGGRDFARLVSAGQNNVIDTAPAVDLPADVGDDLIFYLYRENPIDD